MVDGAGVPLHELVGPGAGEEAELAEVIRPGPAEGVVERRVVGQGVEHVQGDACRVDLAGLLDRALGVERDEEDHVRASR